MNETNFDWDDIRLFLAVARLGGLAAAAASTGKSAPTLGRHMLALERRLGTDLFIRLPRGYVLTEDGEAFLEKATDIERQLAPMISAHSGPSVVKVSAGLWVTRLLCQHTSEIAPDDQTRLRFIASDEVIAISHREAVIGVRNRRPVERELAGRRVARVRFAVYARDESVAPWARVIGPTPSALWVKDASRGGTAIEVTNARNALDLALCGAARCVLPTFVGASENLRQISDDIEELAHDQWLVSHHEDRYLPGVRDVLDRIGGVLSRLS